MPRPLERCCLQDGLKLDLNRLIRRGQLLRNAFTTAARIRWTSSYWGVVAEGIISASMEGDGSGWFTVRIGHGFDERIGLVSRQRHFGGKQWYFSCPITGRLASVLWRPNGASRFASRQAWGNRVAYRSQFLDRDSRAHHAQAKIRQRLCEPDGLDPEEWDFPPKPKWMRFRTYERWEARFDRQEAILDQGLATLAARFVGK
jgi:hypothetical protein